MAMCIIDRSFRGKRGNSQQCASLTDHLGVEEVIHREV